MKGERLLCARFLLQCFQIARVSENEDGLYATCGDCISVEQIMVKARTSVEPTLSRATRLSVALVSAVVVVAIAIAVVAGNLAVFPFVFLGAVLTYIAVGLYMLKKAIQHN
jgi:hypothetical protein